MKDIARFLFLYRPYFWYVAMGVGLSFVTLFAGVMLLAVSGWFIAAMGVAGMTAAMMNYYTPAAIIRGLSILRTASRYGERLANHDAALRVTAEFRTWFYKRLEPLAPAGLQDFHSADVFNRLRGDIDALERFYLNAMVPLICAVLGCIALAVAMVVIHPPLAILLMVLLSAAGFLFPATMRYRAQRDENIISTHKTMLNIDLSDIMQSHDELLVYGRMDEKAGMVHTHDRAMSRARIVLNLRENAMQALILLATGGAVVGALYMLVPMVQAEQITLAGMAMVVLLCLACFEIIVPLPSAFHSLQAARIAAGRLAEVIDRPVPRVPGPDGGCVAGADEPFSLSLSAVSFSYGNRAVLRDVSLSLARGGILVLQGGSGTGKTTLIDLLLGFRGATGGEISLNKRDLRAYGDETLRSFFSVSPQKPYVFADTLRSNLALAGDDDMTHVLSVTGMDTVIAGMTDGMETYLGEHGAHLSGGQIRRLSLTRALLRDAPCLILDEPCEGLDGEAIQAVMPAVLAYARRRGQAVILCLHDASAPWIPRDSRIVSLDALAGA